jgi:hypothetical protein
MAIRSIEISERAFDLISRAAVLDRVDVATCLETMVMKHSEYIRAREYVEGFPRLSGDEDEHFIPSGGVAERQPPQPMAQQRERKIRAAPARTRTG